MKRRKEGRKGGREGGRGELPMSVVNRFVSYHIPNGQKKLFSHFLLKFL